MLSHLFTGVRGLNNDADIFVAVEHALSGEPRDAYDVQLGIMGADGEIYGVFLLCEREYLKASRALVTQGLVQLAGTDRYRALFSSKA